MRRLQVFESVLYVLFALLLLNLFYVQVVRGSYYRERSEHNRIRLLPIKASRGTVYDRWGEILATSRPSLEISIIPRDFVPSEYPRLAQLLGVDEASIREKMAHIPVFSSLPVPIKRDVSKEIAFQLEEHQPELSGILVQVQPVRFYPQGEICSHILGYLGRPNKEEFEQWQEQGLVLDTWVGRSGLEKVFDETLRGGDGGKQIEVNARGQEIRVLSEREPLPGEDLHLTIDSKLQEVAWKALGERKGTICVMDVTNWEVLALVSKPGYDPNLFVDPKQSAKRLALFKSRSLPFLNRAISSGFPPGSIFKLVVATAGLELGKITPSTTFHCKGSFQSGSRAYKCWLTEGHGSVNLYQAIERSCNVYFYNVGRLVGAENIARYARLYGLGEKIPIELPLVASGLVPDPLWKSQKFKDKNWYPGETLNFAIGQGYLLVTPLQIVRMVGVIAKDGEIGEPTLIQNQVKPKRNIQLKASTIDTLRRGMLNVVQGERGTGQYARVEFFQVAAKTGTAQVPLKEPHAWFTGFFPYPHPEVAIVVFVEHGGSGGISAAPIAKQMITAWNARKAERKEADQMTARLGSSPTGAEKKEPSKKEKKIIPA